MSKADETRAQRKAKNIRENPPRLITVEKVKVTTKQVWEKNCHECGTRFLPNNYDSIFCSILCTRRFDARRRRAGLPPLNKGKQQTQANKGE